MFDTMTLTKIVGSFCGALLVFMMGNWAAETLYSMGGGHGGDHQQAYVIDTGEDEEDTAAAEDTGPTFAELFVSADAGKGERVFNKCKACHALEQGANGVGPYLYGVVGRETGGAEGYTTYSGALGEVTDAWTPRELDAFLENPAGYAPGTSMGFAGLRKPEDRANVIAYLDQTDGDTYEMDLPEEQAEAGDSGADMAEETADASAATEMTTETEDGATADAAETTEESGAAEGMAEADTQADTSDSGQSGFAAKVAAADPAEGKKVYRQCQACHVADKEQNRVGPHLVNLIDREIASVDGFNYSDALTGLDGGWTVDELNAWLEDPRGYAPGNRMSYPGLRSEEERAAVIAYLESLGG